MLMIISPSKTQQFGEQFHVEASQPLLLQNSNLLINELRKNSVADLKILMKMSERLALLTNQRINDFKMPFTAKNARSAIAVFQGDVYSHIAINEYLDEDVEYLQNHLRILSGLYGILRPLDLIQAYRLEMGCKLKNDRGKNLYEFWGDKITDEVNRILDDHREPILVDLASNEYSRVINKKNIKGSILQIAFKEQKGMLIGPLRFMPSVPVE